MRIVISGTVGVGKSTVSDLLNKELKKIYHEKKINLIREAAAESIYLKYYYRKPDDWAFISQVDFLLERFKMALNDEKIVHDLPKNEFVSIYDRHVIDDYIFAELHSIKNNIIHFHSLAYQVIYNEILNKLPSMNITPDYFILLTGNLDTIIDRINNRGRSAEMSVDTSYWKDLYNNYYYRSAFQNHFKKNSKEFIKINTDNKTPEEITKDILKIITKDL